MTEKQRLLEASSDRQRLIPRVLARPALAISIVTAVLVVNLMVLLPRPLSPDVSGQLWIAGRLLHGSRLYLDVSEVNPPLWFWLAIPAQKLADVLHTRAEDILILLVGFAGLASLFVADVLIGSARPRFRSAFFCYAAVILLLVPLRDFGQREQLALIGSLPYVILIGLRRQSGAVPLALAGMVGVGAAVGFALKPHFAGVPILLEAWLIVGLRRAWRPLRPETCALVSGAIGYIAAILIVTPGYLQVSVPEVLLAYGSTGAPDLLHIIRPAQPIWILILSGIIITRLTTARPLLPLTKGFLIAALGFAAAWLTQFKGWPYQSIATTGSLAFALASELGQGAVYVGDRPRLIGLVALAAPLLLCVLPTQWVPTAPDDITPAIADLKAGDVVAIVSTEGWTAWPTIAANRLRFSGRRSSFWILKAIDANRRGTNDVRIEALGRKIVGQATIDYRCLPPQRLIFLPSQRSGAKTASENPFGYFVTDPRFRQLMRHYRRGPTLGNFDSFSLVVPFDQVPASLCPLGVIDTPRHP